MTYPSSLGLVFSKLQVLIYHSAALCLSMACEGSRSHYLHTDVDVLRTSMNFIRINFALLSPINWPNACAVCVRIFSLWQMQSDVLLKNLPHSQISTLPVSFSTTRRTYDFSSSTFVKITGESNRTIGMVVRFACEQLTTERYPDFPTSPSNDMLGLKPCKHCHGNVALSLSKMCSAQTGFQKIALAFEKIVFGMTKIRLPLGMDNNCEQSDHHTAHKSLDNVPAYCHHCSNDIDDLR